jgi:hypothetical protein
MLRVAKSDKRVEKKLFQSVQGNSLTRALNGRYL